MPKGDFIKTQDSIVPLRGVVRDGKLAALLDQEGKEIGMPVTAVESVTGGIGFNGTIVDMDETPDDDNTEDYPVGTLFISPVE